MHPHPLFGRRANDRFQTAGQDGGERQDIAFHVAGPHDTAPYRLFRAITLRFSARVLAGQGLRRPPTGGSRHATRNGRLVR